MDNKGFTLLEVSLFLAISAALAVIVLASLAPRIANVRFSSSVRKLEAGLQKNTHDIQFGVSMESVARETPNGLCNIGTTKIAGTSGDCVLAGRLIKFGKNAVTYYPIVTSRLMKAGADSNPVCAQNDTSATKVITCYSIGLVNAAKQEHGYEYGQEADELISNQVYAKSFGVIRDPANNQTSTFIYNQPLEGVAAPAQLTNQSNYDTTNGASTGVCMVSGPRKAKIEMVVGSLNPKVQFGGCS